MNWPTPMPRESNRSPFAGAGTPGGPFAAEESVRLEARFQGVWRHVKDGESDGVSQEDVEEDVEGFLGLWYDRQASLSRRGVRRAWEEVLGQAVARLFELQQERLGEEHTHPRRIEPGGGAGASDEANSAAHTEFLIQAA
jgi:hypothetical protein